MLQTHLNRDLSISNYKTSEVICLILQFPYEMHVFCFEFVFLYLYFCAAFVLGFRRRISE